MTIPRTTYRSGPERTQERRGDRYNRRAPLAARVAQGQGLYYLATGAWSLIDIDSFQRVTGPKTDLWLVRTVGTLVGVVGGVLWSAGRRGHVPRELARLAQGTALGLGAISLIYPIRGTISKVYLLDAAAEGALVLAWQAALNEDQAND